MEKPKSKEEAFLRLQKMSEQSFSFYTGIHIIDLVKNISRTEVSITNAKLRKISKDEIDNYLNQDQDYTTFALGFDPLNMYSCTFISSITGSYNNILKGIPLERIIELLNEVKKK